VGAAVAAVVCVLAAAPLGLLWGWLAPRAGLDPTGDGGFALADVEDRAFLDQDLLLVVVVAAAGLLAGLIGWRLGRRHRSGVLVGLVLGGFAAAYVCMRTGVLLDGLRGSFADGTRSAADGLPLELPNDILRHTHRSPMLWLCWPAASALVFAVLTSWPARVPGPPPPPPPVA
jgi:hypothetical protein